MGERASLGAVDNQELVRLNSTATMSVAEVENSPEYQALLVAAAGKPERSMGDSVIPAEPPVWSDVRKIASSLLTDPPHLSVLIHLVKASAYVDGFAGVHQALSRLYDDLTNKWDDIFPPADQDDPDDPYYERVNYLRDIAEDPAFVNSIQRISLVDIRGLGAFSSRDIDIASGKINASEDELSRCQEGLIRGAFGEVEGSVLAQTLQQATDLRSLCDDLVNLFNERAGSAHGLSFAPLQQQIDGCITHIRDYGSATLERLSRTEEPTAESGNAPESTTGEVPTAATATGAALADRQSVCTAFDQIILYYQLSEPSSPVPILAQRARDMVQKTFFDALEDLAPAEKGNLPALLGVLVANPMASLMSDSYQRFLNGERVQPADTDGASTAVAEAESSSFWGDSSGWSDSGEDADASAEAGASEAEPAPEPEPESQPEPAQPVEAVAVAASVSAASLNTRADVMNQLNLIEGYFNQHEPSSPVPLIVAEIRKLLPKTFTDLIAEFNDVLNPSPDQADEES